MALNLTKNKMPSIFLYEKLSDIISNLIIKKQNQKYKNIPKIILVGVNSKVIERFVSNVQNCNFTMNRNYHISILSTIQAYNLLNSEKKDIDVDLILLTPQIYFLKGLFIGKATKFSIPVRVMNTRIFNVVSQKTLHKNRYKPNNNLFKKEN